MDLSVKAGGKNIAVTEDELEEMHCKYITHENAKMVLYAFDHAPQLEEDFRRNLKAEEMDRYELAAKMVKEYCLDLLGKDIKEIKDVLKRKFAEVFGIMTIRDLWMWAQGNGYEDIYLWKNGEYHDSPLTEEDFSVDENKLTIL